MSARVSPNTLVTIPDTDTAIDLSALSAHIAHELAAGLSNPKDIRTRYNISAGQWNTLKNNSVFRGMLADAMQNFAGDMNAGARIQKKADIVLEDAIPEYDAMIHDKAIPAAARIEAGKLLKDLAGRGSKAGDSVAPGGGGFILNINLGDKKVSIDGVALEPAT